MLLRQQPPREVPRALSALALRGARRWQVGLACLAVICGFVVAAFFPWPIVDDIRLDLGGSAGRGDMLASAYAKRTLGDGTVQRKRLVFSVRFRFDDCRGREHVAKCLFFGHVPPGTELDVEFLPSNPTVARLKDGFFVAGGLWEVLWNVALPRFRRSGSGTTADGAGAVWRC
jgi:hypothetical protein